MNKFATFFRESMLARFLIPMGIVFIVFSIFWMISINNSKNYIETDAVVTKTELYEESYTDTDGNTYEATYTVYVKYTVDGTEYEQEYGIFSGYKVGKKIKIAYNPENPQQIVQPSSIVFPIILLVAGVCSIIGAIFSIIKAVKKQKAMKLQEEGWSNGN